MSTSMLCRTPGRPEPHSAEVMLAACSQAALSLLRWTNGRISMRLEDVTESDLGNAALEPALAVDPWSIVMLAFGERDANHLVLAIDGRSCEALIDATTESLRSLTAVATYEARRSVLLETGNIVGCALVNVLADRLDEMLVPATPVLVEDFGFCALDELLATHIARDDFVVNCRMSFQRVDEPLPCQMYFLPSRDMWTRITSAAGRPGEAASC